MVLSDFDVDKGHDKWVTLLWVRLGLGEQPFSFVCDLARD